MKRRRKYTFRGTPVYAEVGVGLKEKARKGELGDYGFVAGIMAIPPSFGPTCYEPAWDLLDEMAEDDVKADRPMLSALVVKLGRKRPKGGRYATRAPGAGFYTTAYDLHRAPTPWKDIEFWKREVEAVHAFWSEPKPESEVIAEAVRSEFSPAICPPSRRHANTLIRCGCSARASRRTHEVCGRVRPL